MFSLKRALVVFLAVLFVVACRTVSVDSERTTPVAVTPEEARIRLDLVQEIKAFEAKLGWKPTDNFREYSETLETYNSCGRAETLSFMAWWDTSTKEECKEDGRIYDTTYSEAEAIAGSGTPVSRSLMQTELSRFIYVVFHEDFHEQMRGVPTLALNESATQLVGLLAAREFTRERYGKDSDIHRAFVEEIEFALKDANIEKHYYQELERLYERVSRGELDRAQGLKEKAILFEKMQSECEDIRFVIAVSCNRITNNILFVLSIPYAMHYPLFFDLYKSCALNVKRTGVAVMRLVGENQTEEKFVSRVKELIRKGCAFHGAS